MVALSNSLKSPIENQRLAAIAQVAAGLSHESRGALQRIGASAEMLEWELRGNPAALKHVERIQQSQMHLHRLLEDVRSYAALEALDSSPLRLSEIWREAWRLLAPQRLGRDATLSEYIIAGDLLVEGDYFRLVQVFRNVLENSLAATSDPVRVEVICEAAPCADRPGLRIIVRDNGPGLDAEQRRRIFEPFFTTRPTGTGLGMAIAQRIVEAHGGAITIGDHPPPGAEVIIALPR